MKLFTSQLFAVAQCRTLYDTFITRILLPIQYALILKQLISCITIKQCIFYIKI